MDPSRDPRASRRQRGLTRRVPGATYRLQLHRGLPVEHVAALVEYLHALGVTDLYCSPLGRARAGSEHGYDVTDPTELNPEIGTMDELRALADLLRAHGMGLLLDVVPNHLCISDAGNRWWQDVLENGPASPFARFFDVDWKPPKPDLTDKVLLPILHDQYGRVLEAQQIRIVHGDGGFAVHVGERELPLAPRSWRAILGPVLRRLRERQGDQHPDTIELASIVTALDHLPGRTETDHGRLLERQREKEVSRRRLATLSAGSASVVAAIREELESLNGRPGVPESFDALEALLAEQPYRLSYWGVAVDEINYRRFFDVNDLAAVRVEDPAAFAAVHELVFRLVREGVATGLRIDHVDGLFDPPRYLEALQGERPDSEPPGYVVVEKILTGDEQLSDRWPVHGTTGYERLAELGTLFVDGARGTALLDAYRRFTGETAPYGEVVYESKRLVLETSLAGELHVLARRLDRISEQHRTSRDFTLNTLESALAEVIACFPVYRTYIGPDDEAPSEQDRRHIEIAIRRARRRSRSIDRSVFAFLRELLLLQDPGGLSEGERAQRREFVMRLQQLTSPIAAKGVEDTAFYRFTPLASLCEVGGDPERLGSNPETFHRFVQERVARWPHGLTTTATHDTKRGEDARCRIHALSEIPSIWETAITRWREHNAPHRTTLEERELPSRSFEYLLYQTLLGSWPAGPLGPEERQHYRERVQQYCRKALREAKVDSTWIAPDEEAEGAVLSFVERILDPAASPRFLENFAPLQEQVAWAGAWTSLAQLALKSTMPGVPDFYQGTELWDLSLVDPDNRRPVDYALRRRLLGELDREPGSRAEVVERVAAAWPDGRIKLLVTRALLGLRARARPLFDGGRYEPLEARGTRSRQVIAFTRRDAERCVVVLVGRFFLETGAFPAVPAGPGVWAGTHVIGDGACIGGARLREVITGLEVPVRPIDDVVAVDCGDAFARLPVAVLEACP